MNLRSPKFWAIAIAIKLCLSIIGFSIYAWWFTIDNWHPAEPETEYVYVDDGYQYRYEELRLVFAAALETVEHLQALVLFIEAQKSEALAKQQAAFDAEILRLTAEWNNKNTNLENTNAQLQSLLDAEKAARENDRELSEAEKAQLRADIALLTIQVGELTTDVERKVADLVVVNALNTTLEGQVTGLQSTITSKQIIISSLELTNAQGQLVVDGLQTQVSILTLQATQAQALNQNLATQISGLQTSVVSLNMIIETLQSEGGDNTEQIQLLSAQVENLTSQMVLLLAQKELNETTLKNVQTKLTQSNDRINELLNRLATYQEGNAERQTIIDSLREQLELKTTQAAQIPALQATIDQLQADVLALALAIEGYRAQLANLESFAVVFVVDGNVYASQTVAPGAFAKHFTPTNPFNVRYQYTFDGWFFETQEWFEFGASGWYITAQNFVEDFQTFAIAENVVLQAAFTSSIWDSRGAQVGAYQVLLRDIHVSIQVNAGTTQTVTFDDGRYITSSRAGMVVTTTISGRGSFQFDFGGMGNAVLVIRYVGNGFLSVSNGADFMQSNPQGNINAGFIIPVNTATRINYAKAGHINTSLRQTGYFVQAPWL